MKSISRIFVTAIILCGILTVYSCDSEPEIEIEADSITVGFEDHTTVELTKGTPEFKEVSDESIRIYQGMFVPALGIYSEEDVETIKNDNKWVEIEFDQLVKVTTSMFVEEEERSRFLTNEGGYLIYELTSALFVFTGEYAGHVLPGPNPDQDYWGMWATKRSFGKLDRMVDALAS